MRVLGVKFDAEGLGGGNWEDIFKKIQRKGREPTCPVRGLALGQAGKIWKEVAHPDLLNRHRDLAWQVAHGVLPVRAVMHRRGMSRIAVCPRDGCGYEEPVRHLLWDCEAAQALWKEVCPLLQHLHLHPGITLPAGLIWDKRKNKSKCVDSSMAGGELHRRGPVEGKMPAGAGGQITEEGTNEEGGLGRSKRIHVPRRSTEGGLDCSGPGLPL
ncbi:uncharacterized protein LOC118218746 [Anguilla anguilla]|uniref:uncharacterized protein LOC118218746 n=1 Tax=Anguilla anguilla TaxID=7936 RepID=UPI0015A92C7D|nr:uncharacterized protein LOC118218746 [Anguilla anguilla]